MRGGARYPLSGGLQVPRKRPRRRIATGRPRPLPATGAGYLWAYDFVFDACANGQQLKCLTVIDEYTRECLAIDVAGSIRSNRVIEVLARLVSVHGAPKYLRSDNGPEFVSRAILKWLTEANIDTAYIDPGKPWLNGMNESFNSKFRDECLNMQWFKNRIDAKILIEDFRRQFNEVRPHSSLGLPCLARNTTQATTSDCSGPFHVSAGLPDRCVRGPDRLTPNPSGSAAPSATAHRPQGRYRPVPDPIPSKAPQNGRPEFGSRCSY
jgi:putative transposase